MKIKKIIILIFIINLIFLCKVNAVTIHPNGAGAFGDTSADCNAANCANSIGLTLGSKNFANTAVYGIRITIVDKKNNTKYGPINFWATTDMKTAYESGGVEKVTNYPNMTDPTASVDSANSLYNYPNNSGGLRRLDVGISSYQEYIFDLDADQIKAYLNKFNSSLTLTSVADSDYYFKCEPIFVYHYDNYKNPSSIYFAGTVKEILQMITNDTFHNCSNQDYCGQVNNYNINFWTLGYLSCGKKIIDDKSIANLSSIQTWTCKEYGNGDDVPIIFQSGHNILRNYITTVYQRNPVIGTSFPSYGQIIDGSTDRLKLYRKALSSNGGGLSVGYIRLSDFSNNTKITIYKYGSDGNCYDAPAYFALSNNRGNLRVGGFNNVKGYDSWCNADGSTKSIVYNASDYSSIVKGDTYNLYEYESEEQGKNSHSLAITTAQYSLQGGPYAKINSGKSYYSFVLKNTDTVIKVKNDSTGGECTTTEECCNIDLNNIIGGCSENKCSNSVEVAKKLLDLYDDYSEEDYNMLLNYEFTSSGLAVSNVKCQNTSCSSGGLNSPSCENDSTLSPSSPSSSINRRVCYIFSDLSTHESSGSYYYDDIDAYCELEYKFDLNLPNEQVKAGMLLWRQFPGLIRNIGSVNVSIHCENGYRGVAKSTLQNRKLDTTEFLDDIIPTLQIKWKTYGNRLTEDSILVPSESNNALTNPNVDCSGSGTGEYCYVTWNESYLFDIRYNTEWYTNDSSGIFISKNKIADFSGFSNKGSGIPISVKEKNSTNNKADIIISTFDGNESFSCPYSVKNDILKCPSGECDDGDDDQLSNEFNFDFRIIDTSNPFPGIDGNGRYVGDNWCADSRIGKIAYNTSGEKYMIGDVIGDDFSIESNEYQTNFAGFTLTNKPSADIDGDGAITYSDNCNDTMNDYCILFRYAVKTNRKNNCESDASKNNIIKKYITDAPNSDSTDKPMYSFTLTPDEIQNIRAYNKGHAYNDFNMVCDENERNCLSKFLTDWINNGQVNSKSIKVRVTDTNSSCYNTRAVNNKLCTNN